MDVIHSKEELHTSSDYDQDAKSPANDRRNNADQNDDNWILQIKMVGSVTNQSDFHISLHPNDDIIQLYHQITTKTDIPYHQQRLIYRGRLLPHIRDTTTANTAATSSKNVNSTATEDVALLQHHTTEDEMIHLTDDCFSKKIAARTNDTMVSRHLLLNQKVRDIVGLMNGHAIHLVVRQNDIQAATGTSSTDDEGEEENEEGYTATITSDPASTASSSSSSSSGSTSLLAALLGMSGGNGSNERSSGVTSSTSHPRRHHTYRLTDEDWIRPDPGPLETVRQGLMTFHTLQQFNPSLTAPHSNNDSMTYPHQQLPTRRHFYLGQWIDCRDTVNQWLEATVVSILYPRDIMHLYHNTTITPTDSTSTDNMGDASLLFQPTTDPPIAVTDFDGRRRLLLEPCTESESEECIDGEHYRRRANNEHVQILHIHYNGWPVRWDEWIRSDSERIRVFRTRTRHQSTAVDQQSQRHYASPNIDSVMPDAPYTYITNSEQNDRSALLPELHRAIQTLQDRVATVSSSAMTTAHLNAIRTSSTSRMNHLPWNADETTSLNTTATTPTSVANHGEETHQEEQRTQSRRSQVAMSRQKQRQELEALAPLLDRLGRVLIDAAPQVLALADTVGQEDDDDEDVDENHLENSLGDTEPHETPPATNTLGGLLSLLNRDRRGGGRGSVASGSNVALPSVVSDVEISTVASSSTTTTDVVVHPTEPSSTTNLGANNILDPDDDADDNDEEEVCDGNGGTTEYIDPDYRDFAAGLINTSRGDVRSTNGGGSSRRASSSDDGTTSLLGAYLAAMSLGGIASISAGDRDDGDGGTGVAEGWGRIFRDRGSGSGGIDIHIHAVVTAPGLDGAIGFAALAGGGGGVAVPVATPITGQATTTNGTNGALGNLVEGSTVHRRAGSRRFRSMSATTPDTTIDEHLLVGETTIVEEEDSDLFADLYSETPDPINPNNPTYQVPTITVLDDPNEDNVEYQENPTTFRQNRSRSLRRIHVSQTSNSGDNSGEQYQTNTHRIHRSEPRNISNEQRNSSNGNNNLLRRIFRRPDGGH